jgi:hypothetical protein
VFRSRRSIVSLTKSIASCWSTAFTSRNYGRRIEPVKSVFIRLYCYQQILTEDGNLMCTTLRSQHDNCKRVFQAVYCSKKLTVHYTTSVGVYGYLCVHKYAHITNEMQTKTLSRDSRASDLLMKCKRKLYHGTVVRERPHPTMDSSMSELDSVAAGAPRRPVDYCRRHPPIEVTV